MKLKAKYKWNGEEVKVKPVYLAWHVGLQYKTLTGYSAAKKITMAQTAVEWFFDNLKDHQIQAEHFSLYQQAKQMEKEQTIEDFINGSQWSIFPDDTPIDKIAEQYYNETYNK